METLNAENQTLSNNEQKRSSFQALFDNLSHVIEVSREKFDLTRASNSDKQKWARLLIQGCEAYGKLMETAKIEEIESRISALENEQPRIFESPIQTKENLLEKLRREENERKKGTQYER